MIDWEVMRAAAEELGFYPASVKPEDVERLRARIAAELAWEEKAAATSLTKEQTRRKYAHLR